MRVRQTTKKLFTNLFFHQNPLARTLITLSFCSVALYYNFVWAQVFCIPVWWAQALCLAFIISLLLYPFTPHSFKPFLSIFIGIGVPICLYCILFLSAPWDGSWRVFVGYFLGIFWFGLMLPAFLPFYLLWHIYRYIRIGERIERWLALCGTLAPIVCFAIYLFPFKMNHDKIIDVYATDSSKAYFLSHIPVNHFSERILGTGFKYHTKICWWRDGWRPPLHDPFYNTALLIFSDTYYPLRELGQRIDCYRQLFPNEPVRINCRCSESYIMGSQNYLEDDWDEYIK